MKRWVLFGLLCIVLGLISQCTVGCAQYEEGSVAWFKHQQKLEATRRYQKCLMDYRAKRWPNEVYYADHPCNQVLR